MTAYKSNFDFRGLKEGKFFKAGEVIELSDKRASEIQKTIEKIEPKFKLEKVEEEAEEKPQEKKKTKKKDK